jgi:glycosyltransferase involved in cell wall biosynthesis
LDQTLAPLSYVERVLAEERRRWPDWETPSPDDGWQALAEREAEEWELADAIVAGSPFVAATLRQEAGRELPCVIVPHPPPAVAEAPGLNRDFARRGGGLNVLFAGTLELRKGIQYFWGAARLASKGDIRFRAVGPPRISPAAIARLREVAEVVGAVPRSDMARHYAWADVLVLPTLAEGAANVCAEALAHGVPVITTPCAGTTIRDGREGYLIAPRDEQALALRLEELAASPVTLAKLREGTADWMARQAAAPYGPALLQAVDVADCSSPASRGAFATK